MFRRRRYAVIALSAALFSSSSVSAFAAPTPSPSPSASMDPYKAAQEQYKKDRDIYMLALQDREMKMRVINSTFKSAIDKSTTDARSAMAIATTPDQKNAITSARRTAVASAIISRESAIEALEPLPLPPVQPQRPAKMSPQGMSEQKDKKKR
ncbi:MAG: hypothetical protein RL475_851 [Actinomycetota bacterium]